MTNLNQMCVWSHDAIVGAICDGWGGALLGAFLGFAIDVAVEVLQ
jgi:hypothetical protein